MLSKEAIEWLKSIEYEKFNHDERMILLQAAMIIYPNNEEVERG